MWRRERNAERTSNWHALRALWPFYNYAYFMKSYIRTQSKIMGSRKIKILKKMRDIRRSEPSARGVQLSRLDMYWTGWASRGKKSSDQ